MLLAIDVGNTQTVIGLFGDDADAHPDDALVEHWRVSTQAARTADEYRLILQELLHLGRFTFAEHVTGVVVSSVVPRVTAALRGMSERYLGAAAVVIGPGTRTGMPILYRNPNEVGADRVADAVGAFDLYGGPVVVVDFGTATTVDAVSAKGEYLGGAIVPGIEVSMEALFERAAGLRRVELVEPRELIGRSTADSILSGAVYGFAAMVDGLCTRFVQELGAATVVGTGGIAPFILPYTSTVEHHEPWLTLHGLRVVWSRNQPS